MLKNELKNKIYVLGLLGMLFVLGIWSDYNLIALKCFGKKQDGYELMETGDSILDDYYNSFPVKTRLIDFNGLIKKLIGQHEMNGVTKLNNGYLTEIYGAMDENLVEENVSPILEFNNYCRQKGIDLIYVSPAYKISKYDEQLPAGVYDGHNQSVDSFLEKLRQNDIAVIDLRECMMKDGIDQYDFYFKTDHHWTTEGAFYAYQKIVEQIAADTGTEYDSRLLDVSNYNVDVYSDWHLGMRGQRTGQLFTGLDDFDLIYPKFETRVYNSEDESISSLKDQLINMSIFEKRDINSRYTYDSAYTKTDVNNLQSLDAETDLNVLLLGDSFRKSLQPFMLLTYKRFNTYYEDSHLTLSTSLIEKYEPDVVIIMTWPGYFKGWQYYSFEE